MLGPCAAVKALEKDQKYAPLFALLKIVAYKDVRDYIQFCEEKKLDVASLGVRCAAGRAVSAHLADAFAPSPGLDHQTTLTKMRTLTLCSLGVTNHEATYSALQQALVVRRADERAHTRFADLRARRRRTRMRLRSSSSTRSTRAWLTPRSTRTARSCTSGADGLADP
jgi:hypothetical protein